MSKTTKINQDDVFMQIEKFGDKGPYFVQVPKHFSKILDKLMSDDDETDHRSCKAVLKIFCEEFMELGTEDQRKVETLINCRIAQTETIYDLLSLMLQHEKYSFSARSTLRKSRASSTSPSPVQRAMTVGLLGILWFRQTLSITFSMTDNAQL